MLASQKLAIAAHMHVLLRRKTGRVTDTEWMAENLDYAAEVVRFARVKAAEDGHADLAEWADKLERALFGELARAPQPLVKVAMQALRAPLPPAPPAPEPPAPASGFGHSIFAPSGFAESTLEGRKPRPAAPPQYVGGLR